MTTTHQQATVEAVEDMPVIRITRDFHATPAQIIRAHTESDLFARWVGADSMTTRIERWDAATGGHFRYCVTHDGTESWFYGSFHYVGEDRLVQTMTFEGVPEGVSLETMRFTDLGGGHTRMVSTVVVETVEARDAILASGMQRGLDDGYAALDTLLAEGAV